MSLNIKDPPGSIRSKLIRAYFERSVNDTPVLRAKVPLDRVMQDGEFSEFMHPETQAMWVGFALGMRAAARLAEARIEPGAQPSPVPWCEHCMRGPCVGANFAPADAYCRADGAGVAPADGGKHG